MIKLNLKANAKLWRDIITGWDTRSWYDNKENFQKLDKWCREATGGNDVYSFLDILRSPEVVKYYNDNIMDIQRAENEGRELRVNLHKINMQNYNFDILKNKADDIVKCLPIGFNEIEKAMYIWKQIMKIGYDIRGFSGGFSVPQDVVEDTRFFKDNKTICGTMSALVKMICMSENIKLPCEIVGTTSGLHALNALNVNGHWSIMDWTYGKFKEDGIINRHHGRSDARDPNDFFLTSIPQYNLYNPPCGRIEGFDEPTIKVPRDQVLSAMRRVQSFPFNLSFFKIKQNEKIIRY